MALGGEGEEGGLSGPVIKARDPEPVRHRPPRGSREVLSLAEPYRV